MTTWMIVEDEPFVYDMLVAISEVLGREGLAFVDGEDAVEWIEEVDEGRFEGEVPELALIDIRLPNYTSGPMVGARMRESPILGNVAIVLITAYYMNEEDRREAMVQAGADLFLNKPLPALAELQTLLQNAVDGRGAARF